MKEHWIDSHCHLQDYYTKDKDLKLLINDATKQNVKGAICVGTDLETSLEAISIAENDQSNFVLGASIGLHPHEAKNGAERIINYLKQLKTIPESLVAIGECGLDYFYMHSDKESQRKAFETQLDAAQELNLTVIVHSRDAFQDTIACLKNFPRLKNVIIHCFTGNQDQQRQYLEMGCYISFSGIITFKSAVDVQSAAKYTPIDSLLIETDSPFLAPVPFRGKTNEPKYVAIVGRFLAELKGLDAFELSQATVENTLNAFGIKNVER